MPKFASKEECTNRKEKAQESIDAAKKAAANAEISDLDSTSLYTVNMPVMKRMLKGHLRKIQAMGWKADSEALIAADQGGKVFTWLPKKSLKTQFVDKTFVMATELHPTTDMAAIGGMDNMTTIFDMNGSLAQGAKKRELTGSGTDGALDNGHDGYVASLAFMPNDGTKLLSAGGDGDCILWDWEKGAVIRKFYGHVGDANSIRFPKENPDTTFCTASTDKTCRVWDPRTVSKGKQVAESVHCFEASGECNGSAYFPGGQAVAACCHDGCAFLWDLRTTNQLQKWLRKGSRVSACDFTSSGRTFLAAYEDGHVGLWDTFGKSGIKQKVPAHTDNEQNNKIVSQLRMAPDGSAFATGAYDAFIKIYAPA